MKGAIKVESFTDKGGDEVKNAHAGSNTGTYRRICCQRRQQKEHLHRFLLLRLTAKEAENVLSTENATFQSHF